MYMDAKRSYTRIVQTSDENPESSSLQLKLRIQKDRLIAWGIEWADSNAVQSEDIDGSLKRAGISDLVESIMLSINGLIDKAEHLQLEGTTKRYRKLSEEGKANAVNPPLVFAAGSLTQLEDIIKDLTTSIDTLCDLSRSQHVLRTVANSQLSSVDQQMSKGSTSFPGRSSVNLNLPPKIFSLLRECMRRRAIKLLQCRHGRYLEPSSAPLELVASTNIPSIQLRCLAGHTTSGSSPPSYESATAAYHNRVLASYAAEMDTAIRSHKTPGDRIVLLDYGTSHRLTSEQTSFPDPECYQRAMRSFKVISDEPNDVYTGILRILGWSKDLKRPGYAIVYEIPMPQTISSISNTPDSMPYSFRSFLQHSADTDTANVPCLEDRYRFALNLSLSVLSLHAKGVAHRNINSNNVLFFGNKLPRGNDRDKPWKRGIIRQPYLAPFNSPTGNTDSHSGEEFLYNMPEMDRRQEAFSTMTHDVYSLGLVLLEIGLWMPLVKLYKLKYSLQDFRSRLQNTYVKRLYAKCGATYMKAVEYCFALANTDSRTFVEDASDPIDGAKMQAEFYRLVVKPLERCCSIEDLDDPVISRSLPAIDLPNSFSRTSENTLETGNQRHIEQAPTFTHSPLLITPIVTNQTTNSDQAQESIHKVPSNKSVSDIGLAGLGVKRKCNVKIWSHKIPENCKAYFDTKMLPRIEYLQKKYMSRWETSSMELCMTGDSATSLKPTIIMGCMSTMKVRKILEAVNQEKNFFRIEVFKDQIYRSMGKKKKRKSKKSTTSITHDSCGDALENQAGFDDLNPCFQHKPTCGASIGACIEGNHLPPVSFGGMVLVDGEPYGMSVHHMLEDDDQILGCEPEDTARSMDQGHVYFNDFAASHTWCPEGLQGPLSALDLSVSGDEGYQSSAVGDSEELWHFDPVSDLKDFMDGFDEVSEDSDAGDIPGIQPDPNRCNNDVHLVTQPAIDDVHDDFFPSQEDRDDEHLSSHLLGTIHASSGLRRVRHGDTLHEIDWLLMNIKDTRRQERNIVTGASRHYTKTSESETSSYPCQVVGQEELGGLPVHALGRTSGLQAGKILDDMTFVKMPGRTSYSQAWAMQSLDFGGKQLLSIVQ